ncbi:hypothetical protein J2S05_003691 [Alkalicoccobacillus murimartini]|uniref:Uncharacterized protein n=1 Tax=Alkalicoccobacillus murimartini TaxID=171685 RepID=A0ABT9YLW0_9BACI|nr:hypothetical protein [Alkalicoccobacillus murimartini]
MDISPVKEFISQPNYVEMFFNAFFIVCILYALIKLFINLKNEEEKPFRLEGLNYICNYL